MDKVTLRATLLQQRRAMSVNDWRDRSDRICAHLHADPLVQQAATILAYFSSRQEPDLMPLVNSSTDQEHSQQWGFPRCVGKRLVWQLWKSGDPLQPGKFGILEPDDAAPYVSTIDVDLLLVPAIACDRRGYRLGYGGGFYDRLLSDSAWATKPTIGITFATAYLDQLPTDPWDLPLTGICTEDGLSFP